MNQPHQRMLLAMLASVLLLPLSASADCLGDLDGDGRVNGTDLGLMLGVWNTGDQAADLDGDGTVDGADFGILLTAFGTNDPAADLDGSGEVGGGSRGGWGGGGRCGKK